MSSEDAHPSPVELSRYLGKVLGSEEHRRIERHVATCVLCRAEVATLDEMKLAATSPDMPIVTEPHDAELLDTALRASAPAPSGLEDTQLRPRLEVSGEIVTGFEVGRYVVSRRLGQGAMGQVFAAYDPRLDRQIAIKLLRADLPMVENKALRTRLEREAQALARLSHPNVVGVHDLGDYGDALFIAMDLVEGETLTDWLRTPRSWQNVVEVLRMAGQGLAAAHRAGLVHRDFKPDNVLVGADGVARVSDFGVSRRVDTGPRDGGGDDTITGAGSLIGTPMYMSPEQFQGKPADARSDQFGFCVTLFEALTGQRPFFGSTLRALADAVTRGPPQRLPSRETLPPWLERVVLRGLAARPDDRHPTMDALLTELAGPAPKRRVPVMAVATTLVALTITSALGWREWTRRRDDPCLHITDRVDALWGDDARARVKAGVLATSVPWAGDAVHHIDVEFRRFLSSWAEAYEALCVEREQSAADGTLVARQACLEGRLSAFVSTRSALEKSRGAMLRDGLEELHEVLEGAGCGRGAWTYDVPTEGSRRSDFERLERGLGVVWNEVQLGDSTPETQRTLTNLRSESTALGFPQLAAACRFLEGKVLVGRGSARQAIAALDDAAVLGEASRNDLVVAYARESVIRLEAEELDVKDARTRMPALRAAYQRLGHDPDETRAVIETEAVVLRREGRLVEALAKLKQVLTMPLSEAARCEVVLDRASIEVAMGDSSTALGSAKEAVQCLTGALGAHHPRVAGAMNQLGVLLSRNGHEAEAETMTRAALSIMESDPDRREYSLVLFNYALTLKRQKRLAQALPLLEKALALTEERNDIGRLGQMQSGLAETLQELGKFERALDLASAAVKNIEKAAGEGHALSTALSVEGSILESLGRHEQAADVIRRALASLAGPAASPVLREVTKYELARSLWHDPKTRAEAVTMVREVRAYFVGRGADYKDYSDEADEWLKTHKP